MIKTIIAIYRLRTEVDQYSPHSDFLDDMGGEIGVEFSHHTHRSWMRWLAKCSPSLSRNSFAEKVVRVMKTLFLDEPSVLADSAEPIGDTLVHEPRDIIIWGRVLTGPTPLGRQLLPFTRHWWMDAGSSDGMQCTVTNVAHLRWLRNRTNT